MTAKEMFEKLGYEQTIDNNFYMTYQGETSMITRKYDIVFCKGDKTVELDNRKWSEEAFFVLNRRIFLAITQQMGELGWLK